MKTQSGQIVVEYVLLLAIAVTIGMLVVTQLIARDQTDPDNSGAVIKKWTDIQKTVADDVQDK